MSPTTSHGNHGDVDEVIHETDEADRRQEDQSAAIWEPCCV
jgi:hypothetical protein